MPMDHLFDFLADKEFQDPRTGNLFFPAYIYTYDPKEEYEMQIQLDKLVKQLKRPTNFLDCMVLNLYEEMIEYLKNHQFAGGSLFDQILEMEAEEPDEADDWAQEEIDSEEFIQYITEKVQMHFPDRNQDDRTRVYLLVHGVGDAYPHLRASDFLKRTESLIKRFKLILFYPGTFTHNQYQLFGRLKHDNMYRANHLNDLIQ